MDIDDEVLVDCSDDEKSDMKQRDDKWLPPPDEIIRLYEAIDNESPSSIELEWQCPGRRPPTPTDAGHSDPASNENIDEEQMDKSDFEFQEEMSHLNLAVRPTGEYTPKGSAKKKTTTFDAVLSNYVRHRKQSILPDENN